jgi:hypothetical protein
VTRGGIEDNPRTAQARKVVRKTARSTPALSLATLEVTMTQQYIVGELSVLIAGLYPVSGEQLAADVRELRRRVESAPVGALAPLAAEATTIADRTCWSSLEEGDAGAFARQATAAALLHDFAVTANLLP